MSFNTGTEVFCSSNAILILDYECRKHKHRYSIMLMKWRKKQNVSLCIYVICLQCILSTCKDKVEPFIFKSDSFLFKSPLTYLTCSLSSSNVLKMQLSCKTVCCVSFYTKRVFCIALKIYKLSVLSGANKVSLRYRIYRRVMRVSVYCLLTAS